MRRVTQFAARLVIALGIILSGWTPAMAGSANMGERHMTMPMDMGSSRGTPGKSMPCGGMDCGACIGCACAMPAAVQAVQDICVARPSGQTHHSVAFLSGITFPPDIRPPITRGL